MKKFYIILFVFLTIFISIQMVMADPPNDNLTGSGDETDPSGYGDPDYAPSYVDTNKDWSFSGNPTVTQNLIKDDDGTILYSEFLVNNIDNYDTLRNAGYNVRYVEDLPNNFANIDSKSGNADETVPYYKKQSNDLVKIDENGIGYLNEDNINYNTYRYGAITKLKKEGNNNPTEEQITQMIIAMDQQGIKSIQAPGMIAHEPGTGTPVAVTAETITSDKKAKAASESWGVSGWVKAAINGNCKSTGDVAGSITSGTKGYCVTKLDSDRIVQPNCEENCKKQKLSDDCQAYCSLPSPGPSDTYVPPIDDSCSVIIDNFDCPDCDFSPELPSSSPGRLSCGGTYINKDYSYGPVIESCAGTAYICEETTTIDLPSTSASALAGRGLNINLVNATEHVVKSCTPGSGEGLHKQISALQQRIGTLKAQITCKQTSLEEYRKEATASINTQYDSCKSRCSLDAYREEQKCNDEERKNPIGRNCYVSTVSCNSGCDSNRTNAIEIMNKNIEEKEKEIKALQDEVKELMDTEFKKLEKCQLQLSGARAYTRTAEFSVPVSASISVGNYSSSYREYPYVSKNSGEGTQSSNLSLPARYDFFIPSSVANGAKGITTVNIGSIGSYECPFNVVNFLQCSGKNCDSSYNLIFRPISLTTPFPNSKGTGNRKLGNNWINETVASNFINNNRGVDSYDVYNLTPMYDITLTPSDIKEIRKYNKNHSYNDFTLNCENGLYCTSTFLRDSFQSLVNTENSCAWNSIGESTWYDCDEGVMVSTGISLGEYRDIILTDIRQTTLGSKYLPQLDNETSSAFLNEMYSPNSSVEEEN